MPNPEEQKGGSAQTREQFSSRLRLMRFKRDVFGATIKAALELSVELAELPLELLERDKLGIFKARCAELSSVYTNFQVHQDQIVEFCHKSGQVDVLGLDIERAREVELGYYQTLSVRDLIEARQEPNGEGRSIVRHHSPSSQRCSLPKIKIPQFSGSFVDWEAFRDLFKSIVHDREDISPTEKFSYLKTALSGDALALISSVPFGAAYYPVAWKELSEYFDNPKLLGFNYVDKLLGFPPIAETSHRNLQNFVTTFSEVYASLKTLNIPDMGEFILYRLAARSLDPDTLMKFEECNKAEGFPTISQLIAFVKRHVNVLQGSQGAIPKFSLRGGFRSSRGKAAVTLATANSHGEKGRVVPPPTPNCILCSSSHNLSKCPRYLEMETSQRESFVRSRKLCFNCLKTGHWSPKCPVKGLRCLKCHRRHNTSLHSSKEEMRDQLPEVNRKSLNPPSRSETVGGENEIASSPPRTQFSSCIQCNNSKLIVLGTAVVSVFDSEGRANSIRVLVDSGSMISAISEAAAKRLKLPRFPYHGSLLGLSKTQIRGPKTCVQCTVSPCLSPNNILMTQAVVLPRIAGPLPSVMLPSEVRDEFSDLQLADPSFDQPASVDMLLGMDLFPQILNGGRRSLPRSNLIALKSIFGWIILGSLSNAAVPYSISNLTGLTIQDLTLSKQLKEFWQLEEPSEKIHTNPEDDLCEKIFRETCTRNELGRYMVSLPFKRLPTDMGQSYNYVVGRWLNLERRLSQRAQLKADYDDFLSEYERLGHMTPVNKLGLYYIPHHAVVKEGPTGSKIRVVFDASAKGNLDASLNELLMVGPKLQKDILDILLGFRLHNIAFVTDITKMYRQILVCPEHRLFQNIVWRREGSQALQSYQLNTLTYGLTSSPFLALRVVRQLVRDEGQEYPCASELLLNSCYMDDILGGAVSLSEAEKVRKELVELLKLGGFPLDKWASNSKEFMNTCSGDNVESDIYFDDNDFTRVKVLGLFWDIKADVFSYKINFPRITNSKRMLLSNIARIFDPIGGLSPIVFWCKCLLQSLWKLNIGWDEPVPLEVMTQWEEFMSQIETLAKVQIPRFICNVAANDYQLIGFCDASEKGYGAVIYVRSVSSSEDIKIAFLLAKSKVAPLKVLTIPKLELCAALLLARLIYRVMNVYRGKIVFNKIFAWTDSQTVLSWLNTPSHILKMFVANRVVEINDCIPYSCWKYIPSKLNPADCISRGLTPTQLSEAQLYWQGPPFLTRSESDWPLGNSTLLDFAGLPELKAHSVTVGTLGVQADPLRFIRRLSSYIKVVRVMAYVLRFCNALKGFRYKQDTPLSGREWFFALSKIVLFIQNFYFRDYYSALKGGGRLPPSIARLRPFVDEDGCIRVGGRLRHSLLANDNKQPWLLPKDDFFSRLIVRHYHFASLHGGPRTVEALISQKFWILSVRVLIKSELTKCFRCCRYRGNVLQPIMADLPASRVTPQRPFSVVGVDYGGPFLYKCSNRRNAATLKAYLCLFVCFCTKALHLEIVTSLSTRSFMAAFRRFVCRRGIPSIIHSDCGTNFVGADRYLTELYKHIRTASHREEMSSMLPDAGIEWKFNPPAAPHFGGLWEAGIKSVKFHLRRVIHGHTLNFEEYSTLFCRIEAVLNSRPLVPLSADPSEINCLTPGHFLIGQQILDLPDADLPSQDSAVSLPARWKLVEQIKNSFWRRWSNEYLHTLQQRTKWLKNGPMVQLGRLYLIKEPNLPASCWRMGRVTRCFPDSAGIIRVVELKTLAGMIKRPVVKLVPLIASE